MPLKFNYLLNVELHYRDYPAQNKLVKIEYKSDKVISSVEDLKKIEDRIQEEVKNKTEINKELEVSIKSFQLLEKLINEYILVYISNNKMFNKLITSRKELSVTNVLESLPDKDCIILNIIQL